VPLDGNAFAEPFVARSALKGLAEFEEFELFTMPNRPNAFAVSPTQWSIILDCLTRTD